jgi:SAM-dependent methyltransferase
MILNLACGENPIKDAVNVDILPLKGVDKVVDLTKFPWEWKDNSISYIFMLHYLEHCQDTKRVIEECWRILKPGAILHITVPHSSSVSGIGCLGHYRTFSFNTLNDYLTRQFYMFGKPLFYPVTQKIVWIHTDNCILKLLSIPIQFLIDQSPRFFERFWCFYVGGACEVQWLGLKRV